VRHCIALAASCYSGGIDAAAATSLAKSRSRRGPAFDRSDRAALI
jgi:hypothetical protein